MEPVPIGQNPGKLRERFFRAVLFVAADEDDVFRLVRGRKSGREGKQYQGSQAQTSILARHQSELDASRVLKIGTRIMNAVRELAIAETAVEQYG